MPEPTPYEVYAIRYATVARKSAENFIGGDAHEAGARMDYFVWLARNAERTFVIDTGFSEAAARKRKREFLRSPAEGLRLLGVDAATVENVIVTHLHYDHIGNFDLFPRARCLRASHRWPHAGSSGCAGVDTCRLARACVGWEPLLRQHGRGSPVPRCRQCHGDG
jgi:glyoxylase-like metal-dependent hydrolase (beta-lactamase superfamily II)